MASPHKPSGLSRAEIYERADNLVAQNDAYRPKGNAELGTILRSLGKVSRVSEYPAFDLLRIYSRGEMTLVHQTNTSRNHNGYKTAKAIGHYMLHFGEDQQQAIFLQEEAGVLGEEAHQFALGLLIPNSRLTELIGLSRHSLIGIEGIADEVKIPATYVRERFAQAENGVTLPA